MTQKEKALAFAALHEKGKPVILYNAWDAGSAKAVVAAGGRAVATGSWSVAAAQGYGDGEKIPLDFLCRIAARMVESVDVPVTIDFEGGYARDADTLAANVTQLIGTGAVGINFEDQIVGGDGIYCVEEQGARIRAVRAAADAAGVPLFINARTDLFLKQQDKALHETLLPAAIERAKAYEAAGASGFFAPGLVAEKLIETLCASTPLPVNIMAIGAPAASTLATLGVARISHGPMPYRAAMAGVEAAARAAFAG